VKQAAGYKLHETSYRAQAEREREEGSGEREAKMAASDKVQGSRDRES
jgi:hypothetical protein